MNTKIAIAALAIISIAACGGKSGTTTQQFGQIQGTVFAPNGQLPISGALVYVPKNRTRNNPPEEFVVSTTTGPNGSFTLANVPTGTNVPLRIMKGNWIKTITVNVNTNQTTTLTKEQSTLPVDSGSGAPRIAVVTGAYDKLEDVLAKLGFGQVDDSGTLLLGTEQFDLYNGDGSLPGNYPTADALVNETNKLNEYDIVFVNCGADDSLATDPSVQQKIRNWVNNGGYLYVTDLACGYVEQTFPSAIDFWGSDNVPADQPETMEASFVGNEEIMVNAETPDNSLFQWLSGLGQTTGQSIPVAGFDEAWSLINDVAPSTKVWLRGLVSWFDFGNAQPLSHKHQLQNRSSTREMMEGNKPLTVSFKHGQGQVLYSSYHTAAGLPGLRPQEYILSYLVFEITN